MNTQSKHEATPQPERLSDDELGNLLAAIGNHENKALLSVAMRPDVAYSRSDLQSLFNNIQGAEPIWRVSDSIPFSYCLHSLAPIGLVAKEIIDTERGTIGFMKTGYGGTTGDALAGHLLDYSLKHPSVSLQELFGRTSTSSAEGVRSPVGRIAIFGELLTQELPVRVSDLQGKDDYSIISAHVHSLARDGLLELENRSFSDPIMIFGLGNASLVELPLRPNKSVLPSDIRNVLASRLLPGDPELTVTTHQIIAELVKANSEYTAYEASGKLIRQVNQTMRFFIKQGAVKQVGQFTQTSRSIINLNTEQTTAMEDCLSLIYSFQDADPEFLKLGRLRAATILSDPVAVRILVAKARQASPFANRKSEDERGDLISSILTTTPDATVKQIEEGLIERESPISTHSIRRVLHELEAKEQVIKGLKNKKIVWALVDSSSITE